MNASCYSTAARVCTKASRARKNNLVDFGFRLPSARDNRPLQFREIERYFKDVIFVSATRALRGLKEQRACRTTYSSYWSYRS